MLEIQQKGNMKTYISILQNCELFKNIEASSLLALLTCLNGQLKEFCKGEFVFKDGEQTKVTGILVSGCLQVVEYDYNGNRSIITTIEPLQLFGESYSFCNEDLPVTIEASKDSIVLLINSLKISNPCQNSCKMHFILINNLVKILSIKNIKQNQKIQCLSKRTTKEKILNYLYSQSHKNNSKSFYIPYDRQQLADYLCVERSAMAYEIGKLCKDGIIETKKNYFRFL